MSTRKTLDEKIAAAQKEAEQKQNRLKQLLQEQKAEERKARNHRLCKRGGQVESLLPGLAKLDDEQFQLFVEMCLLTNHTRGVLAELLPPEQPESKTDTAQGGGTAPAKPAPAAANTVTAPAQKQAGTPQNPGANNNGRTAHPNGGNTNAGSGDAARVVS